MSQMENDPNTLETVMRFIKSIFDWAMSFSSLAVPALAGAVVGAFKEERRKYGRGKLISSIVMSAACGCGLAPLFAHFLGIPAPVASSLAFFLGVWGLAGIEVVQNVLRSRIGMDSGHDPDQGEKDRP